MTDNQIKELALRCGFKLKEQPDGNMDLNPYVYEFAQLLILQALYVRDGEIKRRIELAMETLNSDISSERTGYLLKRNAIIRNSAIDRE